MKAVVHHRYGTPDHLGLGELDIPEVGDEDLLIRVQASSVSRSDWEVVTGRPAYVRLAGWGLTKPKRAIIGSDIAGIVEKVGSAVTTFSPGDAVFGDSMYQGQGAFAEYSVVPETAPFILKPASIDFQQAATLPQSAVLGLRGLAIDGGVEPDQSVLIVGAGGGGGTFAIQMAKLAGAEVTGSDNAGKQGLMTSLGADHVIDYENPQRGDKGRTYDRILDFVGKRSVFAHRRALRPGGTYAVVGGSIPRLLQAASVGWVMSKLGSRTLRVAMIQPNRHHLTQVAELMVEGSIKSVIHKTYTLEEVPDAIADLGAGRVGGKAVIVM